MAIRRSSVRVTAAGSAGSATGEGVTTDAVDGVIDEVYVDFLLRLAFTSGSEQPRPGDTLSGATSGATGVVIAVSVTSGSWGDGNAAGNIYINSQSGTFQSENLDNDVTGSANVATIGADSTACDSMNVTLSEAIENPLYGPGQTVLAVTGTNTSKWYSPRKALHDPDDGSEIVGPVDYISLGAQVRIALASANPADSVLLTVKWDDQRR